MTSGSSDTGCLIRCCPHPRTFPVLEAGLGKGLIEHSRLSAWYFHLWACSLAQRANSQTDLARLK